MSKLNVCMVGTGEYTTGYVGGGQSTSDKKTGVIGLSMFDLRRRGKVGDISMAGVDGTKFPAIRNHFQKNIEDVYKDLHTSFTSFPGDSEKDGNAYKTAIDKLETGSAVTIFTPDTTHFPIALYAIRHGMHVLVTKPAVQKLEHHQQLIEEAREHKVFVFVEHHKRFDPAYSDAKGRVASLGEFSYFYAYMSQPKTQLTTFKAWAGKPDESDISYYLNSHHVDIHCWLVEGKAIPTSVTASCSRGIANSPPYDCDENTEDVITLMVEWQSVNDSKKCGTAVYTSSWTAPLKQGIHTGQYFHYVGSSGDIRVDQAKRGYEYSQDNSGLSWLNPFYMKYTPDGEGYFSGQHGYGYLSIETFVDACLALQKGKASLDKLDKSGIPTLQNTLLTTAILHAGRLSLNEKRTVKIRTTNGKLSLA